MQRNIIGRSVSVEIVVRKYLCINIGIVLLLVRMFIRKDLFGNGDLLVQFVEEYCLNSGVGIVPMIVAKRLTGYDIEKKANGGV